MPCHSLKQVDDILQREDLLPLCYSGSTTGPTFEGSPNFDELVGTFFANPAFRLRSVLEKRGVTDVAPMGKAAEHNYRDLGSASSSEQYGILSAGICSIIYPHRALCQDLGTLTKLWGTSVVDATHITTERCVALGVERLHTLDLNAKLELLGSREGVDLAKIE